MEKEYKELLEEVVQLRQWKKEALIVMPDFQLIGKEIGVPLGQSVSDKIVPWIRAVRNRDMAVLENNHIYVTVVLESLGSDEWEFGWCIQWLPFQYWNEKRRAQHIEEKRSFSYTGGATYIGAWRTMDLALKAGIAYAQAELCKPYRPFWDFQPDEVIACREDIEKLKVSNSGSEVEKFTVRSGRLYTFPPEAEGKVLMPAAAQYELKLFGKLFSIKQEI